MSKQSSPSPAFATTHWSVVLAVGGGSSTAVRIALETLCRTYWYPIYAYVRRVGHSSHDAQDLTQEFFLRLLERNDLAHLGQENGRFRSFLLASLKHFLINEWKRANRLKRGGGQLILSIDEAMAEGRYGSEPSVEQSPEHVFERRWALTLLEQALSRLRAEHAAVGKADRFEALKGFLTAEEESAGYWELAPHLGMSEEAVKMAVSRLRKRYRELLRAEVAQTVSSASETDDELRQLLAALV